jgi:biopolymer transport protein TolR
MAGGAVGRGRSGAITGINVTPLVDITLVLLIIFMVTAKLIVNRHAMNVDLPKAASGNEVQEVLSVVLHQNGSMQVNGSLVETDEALTAATRSSYAKDKNVRAVIKADGAVPHARVMHVLDVLRLGGVSKVGFGVVPVPAPGGRP